MEVSLGNVRINPVVLNRYLGKKTIDDVVLWTKVTLSALCFALLVSALYDFFDSRIKAATAALKLSNELAALSEEKGSEGSRRKKRADIEQSSAKSLFGELGPKVTEKKETAAKPAPQTQLGLVGTFIADDVHQSYAIIEDQKKKVQEDFSVNDVVFGEAKVVSIFPDRVEIDRNGTREILKLDETGDTSAPATDNGLPVDEFVVPEAELETALQNLPLLLTQARAVPYFKSGQAVGLRLFAIKSGSLYEKVGLKNGDILKAINGNSLSDITQAAKLFETLKQEKNIGVTVERNREERVFRYQIR